MTLTKAVEAAKQHNLNALRYVTIEHLSGIADEIEQALAALPDKPMSEDEIQSVIFFHFANSGIGIDSGQICEVIKAMKSANVLYVSEEK